MIDCALFPKLAQHPAKRRSAHIAQVFKEMLLRGDIKPGDRLPTEEMLCHHFGVSRTTLRESVQMLRVHGLLEVTPGRGSFVRVPNPDKLFDDFALYALSEPMLPQEIIQARLLLEMPALQKACASPLARKTELHKYVVTQADTPAVNGMKEAAWHEAMALVGGGKLLAAVVRCLTSIDSARVEKLYQSPDHAPRMMKLQLKLNAAIVENKPEDALRLLQQILMHNGQSTN